MVAGPMFPISELRGLARRKRMAAFTSWIWAGTQSIAVPSRVIVNNVESYIACCRAGPGLIQVPRYDVQYLFDAGVFAEVLPDQPPPSMEIAVLYPDRRQRTRRLNAFIEWFDALIRPYLAESD